MKQWNPRVFKAQTVRDAHLEYAPFIIVRRFFSLSIPPIYRTLRVWWPSLCYKLLQEFQTLRCKSLPFDNLPSHKSTFIKSARHDSARDLKIPRFRVWVWVGSHVSVPGCTGNQSNLRYTGWHRVLPAEKCKVSVVFHMPSEHRLKWAEDIVLSDLIAFSSHFLQYATNMPSTQKWKKPRWLLSKSFNQEVTFQVNVKYLIWI